MRTIFSILVLFVAVALLSVPVFAQDASDIEPWACPEGFEGQTLSVYNWATYIAEDTVSNFEELCGVDVIYDTFPTDDEMLTRLRQGNPGYDVVVPSDAATAIMIQEGLLRPLNLDNIPNFANIAEAFRNPQYEVDPDNTYTAPYQWGTVGFGYNLERTGEPITSWDQLFNYDGPVAWLDSPREMLGAALQYLGLDPNTSDPDDIEQAKNLLVENGLNNVVYIAPDDGQEVLARGEVDVTVEYSGDIFQIIDECECDTYGYAIPEEGTALWVDTIGIATDAPNPELAEVFIDYILHPQVNADISNYTAYASPNAPAQEAGLIEADLLNNPGIYPPEETLNNLFQMRSDPELEPLFNDAWIEILILLGQ